MPLACAILLNSHSFVTHPCFRAVGRSENLKERGGTTSNTRSFYGAFFVSNSTKIWRGPLCPPLVPPVLPFFQRSILPKTADSINVNKLLKKTKPKWKVQTIPKFTKKTLWLQSKGQPHPHLLPIQHYYVPILIVWIK